VQEENATHRGIAWSTSFPDAFIRRQMAALVLKARASMFFVVVSQCGLRPLMESPSDHFVPHHVPKVGHYAASHRHRRFPSVHLPTCGSPPGDCAGHPPTGSVVLTLGPYLAPVARSIRQCS
jgi:hypothetical protein